MQPRSYSSIFGSISFYLFASTFFLLPVFVIPSSLVSIALVKNLVFSVLVGLSFLFYLFARLKDKKWPSLPIYFSIPIALLLLSILLSCFTSPSISYSFFGDGVGFSSAFSFLLGVVILFLGYSFGQAEKNVKVILYSIAVAASVLVIFHTVRFSLGTDIFSLGIFNTITSSLSNSWLDTTVLVVAFLIGALFWTTKINTKDTKTRIGLGLIFLFGLFSLFLVHNLSVVVVAVLLLLFVVMNPKREQKTLGSVLSLIFFLIAVTHAIFFAQISSFLNPVLSTGSDSLRSSFLSSVEIIKNQAVNEPLTVLFGNGMSTYSLLSSLYGVEGEQGFNFLLTLFSTLGIIGVVGILLVFGLFAHRTWVQNARSDSDPLVTSLSFAGLFIFTLLLFAPLTLGINSFVYTLALAGIGIGYSYREYAILIPHQVKIFSTVASILLLVFAYSTGVLINRTYATYLLSQSFQEVDQTKQSELVSRSSILAKNDSFYRFQTAYMLTEIKKTLSQSTISKEEVEEINKNVERALASINKAIAFNEANFQNWLLRADVYSLFFEQDRETSKKEVLISFSRARSLAPSNSIIDFKEAEFYVLMKDRVKAEELLRSALGKDNTYLPAYFLLADMAYENKNFEKALEYLTQAYDYTPDKINRDLLIRLSLLLIDTKNISSAKETLAVMRSLYPHDNDVFFLSVKVALEEKDIERAKIFSNQIASSSPLKAQAELLVASTATSTRNIKK